MARSGDRPERRHTSPTRQRVNSGPQPHSLTATQRRLLRNVRRCGRSPDRATTPDRRSPERPFRSPRPLANGERLHSTAHRHRHSLNGTGHFSTISVGERVARLLVSLRECFGKVQTPVALDLLGLPHRAFKSSNSKRAIPRNSTVKRRAVRQNASGNIECGSDVGYASLSASNNAWIVPEPLILWFSNEL